MSLFLHQTTTISSVPNHSEALYMSLFLHQTTTIIYDRRLLQSCICLYSYIKPQLINTCSFESLRCICLYSYIKPQLCPCHCSLGRVVYVSIPTSNHNCAVVLATETTVVYVSIPTSNHNIPLPRRLSVLLYMSLFLHQTTTVNIKVCKEMWLYMSLFLHQTTTRE